VPVLLRHCLTGSFLIGVGISSLFLYSSSREAALLRAETAELEKLLGLKGDRRSQAALTDDIGDLSRWLPASSEAHGVLSEVQRRSREAEVVFGALDASASHQDNQLGRASLAISLRGTYPNIKRVLVEVLTRYPHATTTRLVVRRALPSPGADAVVSMTVWSRADAPPGASSVQPHPAVPR